MKKHLFVTGITAFILIFGVETAHAQTFVTLDEAIGGAAEDFSSNLRRGGKVAVLSIQAGNSQVSDYIIDELNFAIINKRTSTVVERHQLNQIQQEMNFQTSKELNDTMARAIGQILEAQAVITGTFEPIGDFYRLRVRVIDAGNAAVLAAYSANVQNDQVVASLMRSGGVRTPVSTTPAALAVPAESRVYQNFTTGQRWGTYWLNNLIPGLGSYIIMQNWGIGTLQLILGGIGYFSVTMDSTISGLNLNSQGKAFFITVGVIFLLSYEIVNIATSATFNKPRPKNASLIDPEAWNIAVLPRNDGIEQVSLSYTLRF